MEVYSLLSLFWVGTFGLLALISIINIIFSKRGKNKRHSIGGKSQGFNSDQNSYRMSASSVKSLIKHVNNPEHKKVLRYFLLKKGCLSRRISDSEYLKIVANKRDQLQLKSRAMGRLGIDESQVKEVTPVVFESFMYDKAFIHKQESSKMLVSSAYEVTYIFFSADQIYIYSITFNIDDDCKIERTDEYFYKDITSFSTISKYEKANAFNSNEDGEDEIISKNLFSIIVPGDKLVVSMGTKTYDDTIQAMKQKLREKKM